MAKIEDGRLPRPMSKAGKLTGDTLSDWAIWSVVEQSAAEETLKSLRLFVGVNVRSLRIFDYLPFEGMGVVDLDRVRNSLFVMVDTNEYTDSALRVFL